jgi:hypothetical protein
VLTGPACRVDVHFQDLGTVKTSLLTFPLLAWDLYGRDWSEVVGVCDRIMSGNAEVTEL